MGPLLAQVEQELAALSEEERRVRYRRQRLAQARTQLLTGRKEPVVLALLAEDGVVLEVSA